MRTQWHGRPNWNSIVNIVGRWRQDYSLLSWQGRAAILGRAPNQQVYGNLNLVQINNNTTRGSTPGLINPAMGPLSPSVPLPLRGPDEGFPRRATVPNNFLGLTLHIMPSWNQPPPAQHGPNTIAPPSTPQSSTGGLIPNQGQSSISTSSTTRSVRTPGQPPQGTTSGSLSSQTQTTQKTAKTTRSGRTFGQGTIKAGDPDAESELDDEEDEERHRSDDEGSSRRFRQRRSRSNTLAPTRQLSPDTEAAPKDEWYTNNANEYLTEHGGSPLQTHEESRLFRRARERAEPGPPRQGTVEGFIYPAGFFDTDRQARPGNDPFTWPTPNIATTASIDPVTGGRIRIHQPGLPQSPDNADSKPTPPGGSQRRRRNEDL